MIIGDEHAAVVENIRDAAENREFYKKVEVNDPNLSSHERAALLNKYIKQHHSLGYTFCNLAARAVARVATAYLNRRTRIKGLENIYGVSGGAIITGNHFSPMDNTVIRKAIYRAFHQRIYIVSQVSNLAMKGAVGFLMNYTDIIPISGSPHYIRDYFQPAIQEMLEEGRKILIYPEQEMWLNYRKPRPPKRGAYYYAAKNGVPVISCFTEIRTRRRKETDEFYRTKYVLHVLPTIYPDPNLSVRDNSLRMMEIDYRQKKEAYEKAYSKPLTYEYELGDVAGWIAEEDALKRKKGGKKHAENTEAGN